MKDESAPERPLRVLTLPNNIASLPSHTVRGLRSIGVDARGMEFAAPLLITSDECLERVAYRLRYPWRFASAMLAFRRAVERADIVHWFFDTRAFPFGIDLSILRHMKTPCVIEFLGSDVRVPEVEFDDNPWYRDAWDHGYEYRDEESRTKSERNQRLFVGSGFAPISIPGVLQYLLPDVRERVHLVRRALVLDDFGPAYPSPSTTRPRIVHAPSAPNAKGTPAVLRAIDELRNDFDFEFCLVEGVPRAEAMELMRSADVVVDQLVIGDFGMAALEGMAWGKPVVAFVKPAVRELQPSDLPIVEADPSTVLAVLRKLLQEPVTRGEIGERSRRYVERHHDASRVAERLLCVYQEVLGGAACPRGLQECPEGVPWRG